MAKYKLMFYNLDNNRPEEQLDREVRAILQGPEPHVLAVCEAVGYSLPGVDGWRQVDRDCSRPGRENLAAYVRNDVALDPDKTKWHDCQEQWTRPKDPPNQHWPRSILEFRADELAVWVAHQPPKGTDNTKPAQREGIDKLTARMAPWTRDDWADRTEADKQHHKDMARVVLWDNNRRPGEGDPGADTLADNVDGWCVGAKIDGAVVRGRGVSSSDVSYPTRCNEVELESDHGHAFRFNFTVP